jgi:hypothetical protein
MIHLLKKCMGLIFLDGINKSPDYTKSGLDKLYCISSSSVVMEYGIDLMVNLLIFLLSGAIDKSIYRAT